MGILPERERERERERVGEREDTGKCSEESSPLGGEPLPPNIECRGHATPARLETPGRTAQENPPDNIARIPPRRRSHQFSPHPHSMCQRTTRDHHMPTSTPPKLPTETTGNTPSSPAQLRSSTSSHLRP